MTNFDWLGLIAAIGSLIAAASVFAGFTQYRIARRDSYISTIRDSLQFFSRVVNDLDEMVSTEMFCEMVESAIYNKSVSIAIANLYSLYKKRNELTEPAEPIEDSIKKIIGKNNVRLTIQSPIRDKYLNSLIRLSESQAVFFPNFEGLGRLISVVCIILNTYMRNVRRQIVDPENWVNVFKAISKREIRNVEEYKRTCYYAMVDLLLISLKKKDQRDIRCVKAISSLVSGVYLSLSTSQLVNVIKQEKKIETIPMNKTKLICDDFREAGKRFRTVFDTEQAEVYATYVRTFELNNMDDGDEEKIFDL